MEETKTTESTETTRTVNSPVTVNEDFKADIKITSALDNPFIHILAEVISTIKENKEEIPVSFKDGKVSISEDITADVTVGGVTKKFTLAQLFYLAQTPTDKLTTEVNTTITSLIATIQNIMDNILLVYKKKKLLKEEIEEVISKLKAELHLEQLEPVFNGNDVEKFIQDFVNCKFIVYKNHIMKYGYDKPVYYDFSRKSAKEIENFRGRLKRLQKKCNSLYNKLVIKTEQTITNDITPYITNKTDGRIDTMLSKLYDRKTEPVDISKSGNRFNFWSSDTISEITLSIGTDKIIERKKENQKAESKNNTGLSLLSDTGILLKSITTDKLLKYVTMLALNQHTNIIKLNREHYFKICNGSNSTEFNETLDIDSNIIRNSKITVVFDSDALKKFYTQDVKDQIETSNYKNKNIKKGMAVLDTDVCSTILFDNNDIVFTLDPNYLEYRTGRNTGRYKFHLALLTITERYRKEYYVGCKLNQYYKLGTQTTYHKLPHKKKPVPTTKGKGLIPDGYSGIKLATLLSEDITGLFRKDKLLPDLEQCFNKLFDFGYLKDWYIVDSSGNKYSYEVGKREQNREILRTGWFIYQEQTEILLKPDKNRITNNIITNGSKYFADKEKAEQEEPVNNE